MKTVNYYKVLGISPTAATEEIRRAYLELAKKYHPDLHPDDKGAVEKFAGIAEAFRILSQASSRYAYDLELGLEPGSESLIPIHQRIGTMPVTGSESADYVEEIAGGIFIPRLRKKGADEYTFIGLDNPRVRKAYEKGFFSIRNLESADLHQWYKSGRELMEKKHYPEASVYLKEVVFLYPGNILYRFALACCYEAQGKYKEAIKEYEASLDLGVKRGYKCLPMREALLVLYMRTRQRRQAKKQVEEIRRLGFVSTLTQQVEARLAVKKPTGKGS